MIRRDLQQNLAGIAPTRIEVPNYNGAAPLKREPSGRYAAVATCLPTRRSKSSHIRRQSVPGVKR